MNARPSAKMDPDLPAQSPDSPVSGAFSVVPVLTDPQPRGGPTTEEMVQAFVASPTFAAMGDARAVFRTGVGLVVMGVLRDEQRELLSTYGQETRAVRERLRILSYRDVEELVAALAGALREALGPSLGRSSFTAIPRGGLVVLGLLSYFLELEPGQLGRSTDGPLVVVDDCALSGLRFQEFLAALPGTGPVFFAPLLSHPDLRTRIGATEDRVRGVVSAEDLADRAPSLLGSEYEGWRQRWEGRELQGYWTGMVDHLVFPWSEPDVAVWDAEARRTRHGWRVAAPDRCLKNRVAFEAHRERLQINRGSERGYVAAPGVVYADLDGDLAVADLEAGRTVRFEGSASVMWHSLVTSDSPEEAEAALAGQIDLGREALRTELVDFADRLVEMGLLTVAP